MLLGGHERLTDRQTDGQTDRQTDRQGESNIPPKRPLGLGFVQATGAH